MQSNTTQIPSQVLYFRTAVHSSVAAVQCGLEVYCSHMCGWCRYIGILSGSSDESIQEHALASRHHTVFLDSTVVYFCLIWIACVTRHCITRYWMQLQSVVWLMSFNSRDISVIRISSRCWACSMSNCSMSFLVNGIGSCVDGGPIKATKMCLNYTMSVMVTLWSTMETVIPQFLELSLLLVHDA